MKNIKGIIWDMDGVFYRYSEECQDQFAIGVAHAAAQICPKLDFNMAFDLINQSYQKTGGHYRLLKENYNIQSKELNALYHQYMNIDFMKPNEQLIIKMQQMNVEHVLLTQGHRPWVDKVLTKLAISDFFPREKQIVFEDLDLVCDGTNAKVSGPLPFEMALEKLGCKADEAIMIEDTVPNLFHPEKMGITTVHVHPAKPDLSENYLHHIFEETELFVDYFLAQRFRPL